MIAPAAPVLLLALLLAGCARPPAAGPAPAAAPALASAPPAWLPGQAWVFEWTSGGRRGTRHVEILRTAEINGVRYHVVRVGDAHHYFTPSLEWAASVRDSVVEARVVPPQPWFVWPLAVGRRWVHRGVWETREEKRPRLHTFTVVAVEPVDVPAGRFQGLRVQVQGESETDSDEYWYVPEVGWYARWVGRRGDVVFEERLLAVVRGGATD